MFILAQNNRINCKKLIEIIISRIFINFKFWREILESRKINNNVEIFIYMIKLYYLFYQGKMLLKEQNGEYCCRNMDFYYIKKNLIVGRFAASSRCLLKDNQRKRKDQIFRGLFESFIGKIINEKEKTRHLGAFSICLLVR